MNRQTSSVNIKVAQQNMNKSLLAQSTFINTISNFDVALMQEPYLNHLGNSHSPSGWISVYPLGHHDHEDQSHSLILVNSSLSTGSWTQIPFDSPDVTVLRLNTPSGPLVIYNVYNDQNHQDMLKALTSHLADLETWADFAQGNSHLMLAGDFNHHHPLWNDDDNTQLVTGTYLQAAQPLLDILSMYNLHLLLPKGTATLCASSGSLMRLDNIFGSPSLVDTLISCTVHPELQLPAADYFPIHLILDVSVTLAPVVKCRNWREVDWTEFAEMFDSLLPPPPAANLEITSIDQFE